MASTTNRKESERTKLIQEKCQTLLTQMLRDEDNKYCVDCDAKGPRWASWNLGVFLCIRCAGIHRNLGVHISRVKSVNLDTWTPEQVISLQQMGNSRARAVYEAQLPDGFRRPQTDTALESFIRAKYEHKKYLAREWVPPSPPKVDWAKEIDEELEKQKRKKKAAQANSALGIGIIGSDKKPSIGTSSTSTTKSVPLPAPLPKPKSATTADGSPKTHRVTGSNAAISNDLLGLSSPTKPGQNLATAGGGGCGAGGGNNDTNNDSFSNFLSASPATGNADNSHETSNGSTQNSLAKDEEDFFNQGSLGGSGLGGGGGGASEKDKSGKLTKDSILALYGTATTNPLHTGPYGQPPPQNAMFAGIGFSNMNPAAGYGYPQQAQFMTPPNSASMYNTPVMTAPTAFNALGGGMSYAPQYATPAAGVPNAFGQQMLVPNSAAGSIQQSFNMPQTNHNLMATAGVGVGVGLPQPQLGFGLGNINMSAATQPNQATTAANLNQQFGNLNIGNVWQ